MTNANARAPLPWLDRRTRRDSRFSLDFGDIAAGSADWARAAPHSHSKPTLDLSAQIGESIGGSAAMSKTPGGEAAPPPGADDALARAHAALLQDNQLQFHFAQTPPRPDPPAWLEPIARLLSALAPFLQYLFWGGVIIIAGFVLYTLINEIMRRMPARARKQKAAAPEEERVYKPTAAHARALLEEADRLAAEGRYGEAVRVLLHRSVADLERVFALAIGPALTSREIARLPPLSEEGRSVFSGIAAAVEMSLFGGQPLEASRFRACREAYAAFASRGGRR
jgi:hypothetical protein